MNSTIREELQDLLRREVLVLDGAMGTMIQKRRLGERDYRGKRFERQAIAQTGNNDLLSLTNPEVIADIHRQYINAGADIITTNTFNSNRLSMAAYGMADLAAEIAETGAKLARREADNARQRFGRRIYVAGSVGPTSHSASLSPDVADPAKRDVDLPLLSDVYAEQVEALINGGVDLLLIETAFDTLNVKAALDGARRAMKATGRELPIMVSATIADKAGRILSGQTLGAFAATLAHYDEILSLGLNCSFGPDEMAPRIRELAAVAPFHISCHPNAGLPDAFGNYKETAADFAEVMRPLLEEGVISIAGGCCGTTPEHIERLAALKATAKPHIVAPRPQAMVLAGLEPLDTAGCGFITVGERCNVAGSRKFLRLIKERNYDEAFRIGRQQIEKGALVVDINLDDPMLNAAEEMTAFLNRAAAEPEVARVPFMLDSSNWEVIERGLMAMQGKGIVNSISLKEGEETFLKRARRIRELGAAIVVMAFDEKGQADTFERKIEVCSRSYGLLTDICGVASCDIIFDPNVMAIATGIADHNRYALDFIKATAWIKENLPGARVSGGISNLSFSFRGNNPLREAMHCVFLHHATAAGLDMAIMNPAAKLKYDDIEPELRDLLDDVILARRAEAVDELSAYAVAHAPAKTGEKSGAKSAPPKAERGNIPLAQRLQEALIAGDGEFLEADLSEALGSGRKPEEIINTELMQGMEEVGRRFGEGRMFLPQVVKTARTMKQAVDFLRPRMRLETSAATPSKGRIVIATVKGDVHDIGKNIVSIVLECNNFEVIDLGVMVDAETIVETAISRKADIVCLSGLITPSLSEMANVARLMEARGLDIPLIVGGAATSRMHTSLKIASLVTFPVVHARDASQNPLIAARLLEEGPAYAERLRRENEELAAEATHQSACSAPTPEELRTKGLKTDWNAYTPTAPAIGTGKTLELEFKGRDVAPLINWKMFFHAWRLSGPFVDTFPYGLEPEDVDRWKHDLSDAERDRAEEALKLYRQAHRQLAELIDETVAKGLVAFFEAQSEGDDIIVGGVRLPMLRNPQAAEGEPALSLADFVMPASTGKTDYIGVFSVTSTIAGIQTTDSFDMLVTQTLSDRIVEAASELLHYRVRTVIWGYAPGEKLDFSRFKQGDFQGIRPAVGYPCLPDQLLNLELRRLLPIERIGVRMTENGAMSPSSTEMGLYIAHHSSRYFVINPVSEEQIRDYAARRGLGEEAVRSALGKYASDK